MTQEFVSYEQALALKDLGFVEECFACYNNGELVQGSHTNNVMQRFRYAAPLKQQAFRGFREKYEYNTEIVWMTAIDFGYSARVKSKLETVYIGGCDTYEQAEDACINKLIEIIKLK